MIYGERIKQAREVSGLKQTELAARIGCNQSAIAHIENGRNLPTDDILQAIAKTTGFLPSFFERIPVTDFSDGTLCFRSRVLTKRDESMAHQYAKIIYEQVREMSCKLDLPRMKLPKINESPRVAARLTRVALGIDPEKPVSKLISTLESNGIWVFVLPISFSKIDAFSEWAKLDVERPIIMVSANIPGDRLRFSIAHELGHLVLNHIPNGSIAEMEKSAHIFAAEFLMPTDAIKQDIALPVTLTSLGRLKPRWGVSIQALIRRAYDLNVISERQYRYLSEQIGKIGWRIREPKELDIPIESPKVFEKMLDLLYRNESQFAEDMGLTISRARELILYN